MLVRYRFSWTFRWCCCRTSDQFSGEVASLAGKSSVPDSTHCLVPTRLQLFVQHQACQSRTLLCNCWYGGYFLGHDGLQWKASPGTAQIVHFNRANGSCVWTLICHRLQGSVWPSRWKQNFKFFNIQTFSSRKWGLGEILLKLVALVAWHFRGGFEFNCEFMLTLVYRVFLKNLTHLFYP